jgi:F-box protein 28
MPRRESARRNHPLARECDIVETLHMRLTLLQMTFGKHIERKHICFFPGEVGYNSLSHNLLVSHLPF